MSCLEWSRLAARREDEPEGWTAALEHLDGCPRCRPEALKADPLLVFRRLPVTELAPAEERSEAESMRLAVAAMRNAGRLESRHRFAGWRRWAAAAVLALASLALGRDRAPHSAAGIADAAVRPPAAQQVTSPAAASAAEPATIEGLNRPGARVYHMDGEGLSVFMIVDESLDV
ncbi:MAG TPA: hypothetical protein VGQ28_17705 [Thermoanaerobaculia bacterium]|nr:hypothetical protein [Thermoanaerobaculia bacterium]